MASCAKAFKQTARSSVYMRTCSFFPYYVAHRACVRTFSYPLLTALLFVEKKTTAI
jgi:hypothetical protein